MSNPLSTPVSRRQTLATLGAGADATMGVIGFGPAEVKGDLGIGKRQALDEFAVARNAPLVIPPDYSLTPPAPGAAGPAEVAGGGEIHRGTWPSGDHSKPTSGKRRRVGRENRRQELWAGAVGFA